jgi:hypothetical protein
MSLLAITRPYSPDTPALTYKADHNEHDSHIETQNDFEFDPEIFSCKYLPCPAGDGHVD